MSLNHIIYPLENQIERLDIDICDLHCCNIYSDNPVSYDNIEIRAYEQLSPNVIIDGTTGAEQSLFNTTGALGSNLLLANRVRKGSKYKVYSHGSVETNGSNQTFIIRTKLGNVILEQKIITLPNLNQGSLYTFNGEILIYEIGDAGTAISKSFFNFSFTDQQGKTENYFIDQTNNTTFQTTTDATADITVAWDTNNENNILTCHSLSFGVIY